MNNEAPKTAIVLGGYGLIGSACLKALKRGGFNVIGVGRSRRAAELCDSSVDWRIRDIARMTPEDWRRDLGGVDVVVNAAGALQDGLRDDLKAVHEDAVAGFVEALRGTTTRVIQISAAGVSETATTEFFRSKARGDRLLMDSDTDWVVLRPVLVLSPDAYGGTALLRAAAAMPLVGLAALPDARIQTVAVEDVANAVLISARLQIAPRTLADLAEPQTHTLSEVLIAFRAWMGLRRWRVIVRLPTSLIGIVAKVSDAAGWLGWRSPLRSTALQVLTEGVTGDPCAWKNAGGAICRALSDTLAGMPSTTQERQFARLSLLTPLIVATLALFWITSGLIGAILWGEAVAVLSERGLSHNVSLVLVLTGSAVDIALGLALLIRRWARAACIGMIALSCLYLGGATAWAPDLWVDPLGPLVKVFPAMLLSVVAMFLIEER